MELAPLRFGRGQFPDVRIHVFLFLDVSSLFGMFE